MDLTGSIEKVVRKGTTRYRIRLDAGTDASGKRVRYRHNELFPSTRVAKRKLAALIAEAGKGNFAQPSGLTIAGLMVEWLNGPARNSVRTKTLEDYESCVRLHLIPHIGSLRVQDATTAVLQRYYDQLVSSGISDRLGQLCVLRLRSAMSYAVRMQYLTYNSARDVQIRVPRRKEMHCWDAAQARAFLARAVGTIYHPIWYAALSTGMRRGELIGLRWSDVDFARNLLSVRRSAVRVLGGLEENDPKNGKARTIDLDETLVRFLQEAKAQQTIGTEVVFATTIGTRITPANLSREFERLITAAGVPKIRVHDLRHTAATLMLAAGVPVKVVSSRLGHSSTTITLDLYAHVLEGQGQDAAEKLRGLLAPGKATDDLSTSTT